MPDPTYDVIIAGGGFIGLATAYHLARAGASVLLLEARGLGAGSSGTCAGRAQVSEAHPGLHLDLVQDGMARLETLEVELDYGFEWRRLGNIMLIREEHHWREWVEQTDHLVERGVLAEMLDPTGLRAAEPDLCIDGYLGGAYCLEGHVNPFKYCQAFARAARRHGAVLHTREPVTSLERQGDRVTAVHTAQGRYAAGTVVVAAGAWSGRLLSLAGAHLPVRSTNAEAMISEPLPPVLHHHCGMADFYETIHNQPQAVSLGVLQLQHGSLYIAEAVDMTGEIREQASSWGAPGMAAELLRLAPMFSRVRVLRAWTGQSPFLPDAQPGIGWMPGCANLFAATCFHLTVTTTPVLTDLIARMILGQPVQPSLDSFSPARFAN